MKKKISNIFKNVLFVSMFVFLFSFVLGSSLPNKALKEESSEEIDDCGHDHIHKEKLANIETDEILDDVKNDIKYKIADCYGTYWIITFDDDGEAIMTFESGNTTAHVPQGTTFRGLDLYTSTYVSFSFAWGSGSIAYCSGASSVIADTDCGEYYINGVSSRFITVKDNVVWCANLYHNLSVFVSTVTPATCTNPATAKYRCDDCPFGYEGIKEVDGSALGHNFTKTGTFSGFSYSTCSRNDGWKTNSSGYMVPSSYADDISNEVRFSITVKSNNGSIRVNYSVLSEEDCDYLYLRLYKGGTIVSGDECEASGDSQKKYYDFTKLTSGTYELRAIYEKDSSNSENGEYCQIESIRLTDAVAGTLNLSVYSANLAWGNSNYTFSISSSTSTSFSVTTSNSNVTASYNSSTKVITVSNLNKLNVGNTVTITVTGAATSTYLAVTKTMTIKIVTATPTVKTNPTVSAMTYGNALSAYTLSGGAASVAGTFAWTSSSTKPTVATKVASVTFKPTDTLHYRSITFNINISVSKLKLTIPTTSNCVYNDFTQDQSVLLKNYNSAYETLGGTTSAMNAGTYTITFTLKDTANTCWSDNTIAVKSATWTISKANPTISKNPTVSTMTYGNALSAYTLSGGTASVAGTFKWTSGSTKPTVATTTASVTFTPTDTTNYNTKVFTITISVSKLKLTIPSTNGSYTYNTKAQTVTVSNNNTTYITLGGTTSATNAGTYTITFTLKDTANTCWSDNTTAVKNAKWTIAKANPTITTKPTVGGMTYSHKLSEYTLSGGVASVAGTFAWTNGSLEPEVADKTASVTFTPSNSNYNSVTFTITISVARLVIQVPTIKGTYTFNDDYHSPSYDYGMYDAISGTTAMNAGTYYVEFELDDKENTIWSTNTIANQKVTWVVQKATPRIYTTPDVDTITYSHSLNEYTLKNGSAILGSNEDYGVEGTFSWTYGNAKPSVSTKTASVTFTPNADFINNFKAVTFNLDISVTKLKLSIPTVSGGYTYNTKSQTVSLNNYNATYMKQSGTTSATNAGTYSFSVSLNDTANTIWSDNTATAKGLSWTIAKANPTISANPTVSGIIYSHKLSEYKLNGGSASTSGSFAFKNGSLMPTVSTTTAVVVFTPTDTANYNTKEVTITISVSKLLLTKPTITTKYSYNGTNQTCIPTNYNAKYMSITGNSRRNGGSQNITIKLLDTANTGWATDGSIADVILVFTINKVKPTITTMPTVGDITYSHALSEYELTGGATNTLGTFKWKDGSHKPTVSEQTATVVYVPQFPESYNEYEFELEIKVLKLKLELPAQTKDFIYDGTEKQAYMNHVDLTYMKVVNPTWKATNVGEYTVTYQLLDTNNTCWINDSIADRVVTWRIRQATPSITTKPQTDTITYSNNLGKYLLNGGVGSVEGVFIWENSNLLPKVADKTANVVFKPNNTNYSNITFEIDITVVALKLSVPTISGSYVYNKSVQNVVLNNVIEKYMSQSGSANGTNAGSYTLTFTLLDTDNTCWNDKTITPKEVIWTIEKAGFTSEVKNSGYTYSGVVSTPSITNNPGNSGVTYYYSNSIDGTYNEYKGLNNKSLNAGVYYMYAVIAESNNYKSYTTSKITFSVLRATITPSINMEGYVYAGEVSTPSVSGMIEQGAISYYYKKNLDGEGTEFVGIIGTSLDAGEYYIYAVISQTANYNSAVTEAKKFVIEKAKGSFAIDKTSGSIEYPNVDKVTITNKVGDGEIAIESNKGIVEISYSDPVVSLKSLGIGEVVVTITLKEGTNYKGSYVNYTLNIEKGTLVLGSDYNVTGYNAQYDGKAHHIEVVCNIAGATISYSDKENGSYSNNVTDHQYTGFTEGEKTVYYKINVANYKEAVGSSSINILRRKLVANVVLESYKIEYTGLSSMYKGSLDISYDRLISGDVISESSANNKYTYNGSEEAPVNAGLYVVELSGLYLSNNNYEISIEYNNGEMEITKAKLVIPSANNQTIVYDSQEYEYIPTNYDEKTMVISGNVYKNAGSYKAVVGIKDTINYEWENGTNIDKEYPYVVNQKEIEIKVIVNSYKQVYNGRIDYVKGYQIENVTALAKNDTINSIFAVNEDVEYKANGGEFVSDVGSYEITIVGLEIESENYKITKQTNVSGSYEITNAKLNNISYSNDGIKTYDGKPLERTVSAQSVDGSEITYNYNVTPSRTNAGITTVECTISAKNHESETVEYTITINKKTISIVVSPRGQNSVYSGNVEYLYKNDYSIVSAVGIVENDLELDLNEIINLNGDAIYYFDGSTTINQNVGAYTISMGGLNGEAENYVIGDISYNTASLVISEAKLVVSSKGYKGIYDGIGHSGEVSAKTKGNMQAIVYYSNVSIEDAKTKKNSKEIIIKNVGVNKIYYYVEAANHEGYEGTFTIEISKASLSISVAATDYEETYSGNVKYNGSYKIKSVVGLLGSDTVEGIKAQNEAIYKFSLHEQNEYSTSLNQNAGIYDIKLENISFEADNYEINVSYELGTLTINRRSLSEARVEFTEARVEYNGNEQKLYPKVYISLGEETLLQNNVDYELKYGDVINAGNVVVAVKGIGNYKDNIEGSYEISKASIASFIPEIKTIEINVLKYVENKAVLNTIGDIDISSYVVSGYGYLVFSSEYDLTEAIYSNGYQYSYEMIFKSTNNNYLDGSTTINVRLIKNAVVYNKLGIVDVIYNMAAINRPEYEIKGYGSYNSEISIEYYQNGKKLENTPVNVGSYTYKLVSEENDYYKYSESSEQSIIIRAKDINGLSYNEIGSYEYNGASITPQVVVKYAEYELTNNDIDVAYKNNLDSKAKSGVLSTITVIGKGNYTGVKEISFEITAKYLNEEMVKEIEDKYYNEEAQKPSLEIIDNLMRLVSGSDYEATYSNNKVVGKALVEIVGKGNYQGEITKSFNILKGEIDSKKIPSLGIIETTVDSKLNSVVEKLTSYNNQYGGFKFYNNETDSEYDLEEIVADKVGNVVYQVRFVPVDTNYNEVELNAYLRVELNESRVEFKESNIEKVYNTKNVLFSVEEINKLNNNGSCYEAEFANDRVTFNYYNEQNQSIVAPINVGTYYVEVIVAANRKYAEAKNKVSFKIVACDIANVSFRFTDSENENEYEYETTEIKPNFIASYYNEALKESKDYSIKYQNNVELSISTNASIVLTGMGNYKGSKTVEFKIIAKNIAKLNVEEIANQYYNGAEIKPEVIMFNNKTLLILDKDFSVAYKNNTGVGVATITIKGLGNYSGQSEVSFMIINKPIDKSLVADYENLIAYVGTKLSTITLPANEYGRWEFVILRTNEEATVGNVNAKGNRFTIEFVTYDMYSPIEDTISIVVIKNTPSLEITSKNLDKVYNRLKDTNVLYSYDGDGSVEIEYYQNNKLLDNIPVNAGTYEVVVKALETENYEAVSKRMYFTISKAVIDSNDVVVAKIADQSYDNGRQITPELTIMHNDYKLELNTDYSVIYGSNNTKGVGAGMVYIFGNGNYTTENAFVVKTFDIYDEIINNPDFGEVVIIVSDVEDQVYTGSLITPSLNIYANNTLLTSDYYDLSYENNLNVTTEAIIKIAFKNGYSGTKTKTFKITALEIKDENVVVGNTIIGTEPNVVVTVNGNTLVKDTDYILQTTDVQIVGEGEATIIGKGNYQGEIHRSFKVAKAEANIFRINNDIYKFYTYGRVGRRNNWIAQNHESYIEGQDLLLRFVSHNQIMSKFLEQFDNSIERIRVYNTNGTLIDSSKYSRSYVGNGYKLELIDENSKVIDKLTVIITGDLNGDGKINQKDKVLAYSYLGNSSTFTNYQKYALDMLIDSKYDGTFNTSDAAMFDKHLAKEIIINDGFLV